MNQPECFKYHSISPIKYLNSPPSPSPLTPSAKLNLIQIQKEKEIPKPKRTSITIQFNSANKENSDPNKMKFEIIEDRSTPLNEDINYSFYLFSKKFTMLSYHVKVKPMQENKALYCINDIWEYYRIMNIYDLTLDFLKKKIDSKVANEVGTDFYKMLFLDLLIIYVYLYHYGNERYHRKKVKKIFHKYLCFINLANQGLLQGNITQFMVYHQKIKSSFIEYSKIFKKCNARLLSVLEQSEKNRDISKLSFQEVDYLCRNIIIPHSNIIRIPLDIVDIREPLISKPQKKKYTLVLDLDETLIHFSIDDNKNGLINFRPFLTEFLLFCHESFEIVVFTASLEDYANFILNTIEEAIGSKVFDFRFYRQHTTNMNGVLVKDLSLLGRDLSKVIIVDNVMENFCLQKENGILIDSYLKATDDEEDNDNCLLQLGCVLKKIIEENCEDVRIFINNLKKEIGM